MHDTSTNVGPITTDGARPLLASTSPALAHEDALKREALPRLQEGTAGIITWAGAAAAGIARGFFLASASDRAEHGRNVTTGTCNGVTSPECDQAKADARASSRLRTVGWVAVGSAAVLAGTGTVLFFWLGKDQSADRVGLAIHGTSFEYIQRF